MPFRIIRAVLAGWVLVGSGSYAIASVAQGVGEADPHPSFAGWGRPLDRAAAAAEIDTAAEEIAARLALGAAADGSMAQGPSIPSFDTPPGEPSAKSPPLAPAEPEPPAPPLPLPPATTGPEKPTPAAKACLFAAASTLPLVPDARISSASAAPLGSMAGDEMYRDFRVILIVDALGMSTTVEFICRSADTPEIFGAEILSARILE